MTTFSFDDGILSISAPYGLMRLRWTPEPEAEERVPGAVRWKPFVPEFRVLQPEPTSPSAAAIPDTLAPADRSAVDAKISAFAGFQRDISEVIIRAVARFQSHQWLLMLLLHRQPALLDLVQTNPVLAYCLANNDQFRGTKALVSLPLALGHSRQKQRALLEWLKFPGSEAMARLFRRIPPEAASPSLLRRLRYALERVPEVLDDLAHIPVLNAGVLELVVNGRLRELVTPKLLLSVANSPEELSIGMTADQLAAVLTLRQAMPPEASIRPFTSVSQITRFQEQTDVAYQAHLRQQEEATRVAAEHRRQHRAAVSQARRPAPRKRTGPDTRPFPPPPVPGTPGIIPITSAAELKQEGQVQQNCVATYIPNVIRGTCYIYRVTMLERATLSIVPTSDGGWRRAELKGTKNRTVSQKTRQAVDWWLFQNRLSV